MQTLGAEVEARVISDFRQYMGHGRLTGLAYRLKTHMVVEENSDGSGPEHMLQELETTLPAFVHFA